jgi:putative FmdB family regulatory protein
MPSYDYRCKQCGREFSLFYKTYKDYDVAVRICPHCGSAELSRVITRVAVQRPSRDFSQMSSNDMLSVLESGDSRQVGEMFRQVGGDAPDLGPEFHEATERLSKGESMESVERDLGSKIDTSSGDGI